MGPHVCRWVTVNHHHPPLPFKLIFAIKALSVPLNPSAALVFSFTFLLVTIWYTSKADFASNSLYFRIMYHHHHHPVAAGVVAGAAVVGAAVAVDHMAHHHPVATAAHVAYHHPVATAAHVAVHHPVATAAVVHHEVHVSSTSDFS